MDKLEIIINGDNFNDLESFYDEIDDVMTLGLDWKTGHNLNAFNDILRGGFGVHNYAEPIRLIWRNSAKSKADLGVETTIQNITNWLKSCDESNRQNLLDQIELLRQNKGETLYQTLVDIIKGEDHIEFIEK